MVVASLQQRVHSTPKRKAEPGADQCVAVPPDSDAIKRPESECKGEADTGRGGPASMPAPRGQSLRLQMKQAAEKMRLARHREELARSREELLDQEENGRERKKVNLRRRMAVEHMENVSPQVPKEEQQALAVPKGKERDNAAVGKSDRSRRRSVDRILAAL